MTSKLQLMTSQRKQLAEQGMQKALRLRQSMGIPFNKPICVYDLAEKLGIEVRFVEIPSFEGIYCKGTIPTILISAQRPASRQVYTCTHELGHHVFNHGVKADEFLEDYSSPRRFEPEEFLVDCFAGFLLMPKLAVSSALASRGINPQACTTKDIYVISTWLGVGYSTLITHMEVNLRLLSSLQAKALLKSTPKKIRSSILGKEINRELFLIDSHWLSRPIDVQVGDYLLIPQNYQVQRDILELIDCLKQDKLYRAVRPGSSNIFDPSINLASSLRVSRHEYVGRAIYRHLDDPDYE